ncbi:MAG: hypothetical protein IJ842_03885 [Bacilli bacterium]|nr:hypothetical protein [Bacilli bacterium]
MKKIIMRGFIILSIYLLFGLYLVLVGNRVERLNNEDNNTYVNVRLNYND